jgi:hypothetical protein
MGERLECPGCHSETSGVLMAVVDGEPCPHCGLSADAISEVNEVRRAKADDALRARVAELLVERDRLETTVRQQARALLEIRVALESYTEGGK